MGLSLWAVPLIIELLPVLTNFSLFLFTPVIGNNFDHYSYWAINLRLLHILCRDQYFAFSQSAMPL